MSAPPGPRTSIAPETLSAEAPASDPEARWLAQTYRPDEPQLTVRAVVVGMLLGGVLCLSNLYVVLKTGWSFGVTITACILAWAAFRVAGAMGLARRPFGALENNALSTVASGAGFMTGGGNMAAIPALLMLTGFRPDGLSMFLWFAVISALGVFAAIPIKRQLINIEALPFPTGTATAETIRSLHGHGGAAADKARLLGVGGLIGAVVAFLRDAKWAPFPLLPATIGLPFRIAGRPAADWTLALDGGALMLGAGGLMSFRTGWSMLLGAGLTWGVLAPAMVARGVIETVKYKEMVRWTLWGGAALLLASGLLSFAFQWRSVARSFAELGHLFGVRRGAAGPDPLAGIECPPAWFPLGFAVLGPVIVLLMAILFHIPWWAGVVALPLSVLMAVVAARVTGETDTTPTKAMGPVVQFIYGAMLPGDIPANVMGANVTGGAGLHAADLLTTLKSGWLLGASPRKQTIGQLFGVLAGAAMIVPAFNLLVPNAEALGGAQFPAPSALVWASVSKLLAVGTRALHETARMAALCGALLGVALVLAERWAPRRARAFVPSPAGLGLAMVIPGSNAIGMFIGTLVAELLRRRRPALAERATMPLASGLIAGESLMGIALAVLVALGVMK